MKRASVAGILFTIIAAAILATPTRASAAPILVIDNNKLIGVRGLDVNGHLYDVAFVEGSCISLFNGCDADTDFDFSDGPGAASAAQALLDQVYAGNLLDTNPEVTFGCADPGFCTILIPFTQVLGQADIGAMAVNAFGAVNDFVSAFAVPSAFDTTATPGVADTSVYADFTPVPEPASLFLLGTGVVGLGARLRRRRQ